MFTIAKNSNKIAYGIKHFVVDTEAELEEIPLISVFSGSTAFVVEKSARYMLNNKREWIKVSTASSGGSSGGSGNPSIPDIESGGTLDGGEVNDDGIIDGSDDDTTLDGGEII